MGTELSQESAQSSLDLMAVDAGEVARQSLLQVPWLEAPTANLLRAIVAIVAAEHPEFRSAILFGSVARHEERPLVDQVPSDVDVLLLFEPQNGQRDLPFQQHRAIYASVGRARALVPEPPREVQVIVAAHMLTDWDEAFIENVARDGILLWVRGGLPAALLAVGERSRAQHRTRDVR